MRGIILFVCLLFAVTLSAQNDSSFNSLIFPTYTSTNTLTRSDIERLPALNFLELVQGAFPFVANESIIESDYSFIVDGFSLVKPNAINISQIESIRFYPAGTNCTRGSLTKKGTFVIETRPAKNGFSFSPKTELISPTNTDPTAVISKSSNGFYTLNDVIFRQAMPHRYLSSS